MASDHDRLVDALDQLAPSVQPATDGSWDSPPAIRVIDCVLSLNRDHRKFVLPRVASFAQRFPTICSVQDLCTKIASYPSAHDFVGQTLTYKHEARAITLAKVVDWLASISESETPDGHISKLKNWAIHASPDGHVVLGIRGFGLAGFQYLRMLFGADTTKPDIRICEWVASKVGHPVSPIKALQLLEVAARAANVRLRDVDATIWEMLARTPRQGCAGRA